MHNSPQLIARSNRLTSRAQCRRRYPVYEDDRVEGLWEADFCRGGGGLGGGEAAPYVPDSPGADEPDGLARPSRDAPQVEEEERYPRAVEILPVTPFSRRAHRVYPQPIR